MKLFSICTGNICRSAMANIVLRSIARQLGLEDKFIFDSAGVSNEEQGNPMDRRAVAMLGDFGYDISDPLVARHRARQITSAEALDSNTLFLTMTNGHTQTLINRFGADPERVYMWRWFEGADSVADLSALAKRVVAPYVGADLADPWYGGPEDFRVALAQLEQSAPLIVEYAASLSQ